VCSLPSGEKRSHVRRKNGEGEKKPTDFGRGVERIEKRVKKCVVYFVIYLKTKKTNY